MTCLGSSLKSMVAMALCASGFQEPGNSSGPEYISPSRVSHPHAKDLGRVKITVFGLTLSSSWGNGHATPYRAIIRALDGMGHQVHFFEKDVPYYSSRRDFDSCDYCELTLYSDWASVRGRALSAAADSDVVITASFLPEGRRINEEILDLGRPLRVFYDLDTPVTLNNLRHGEVEYLDATQISEFDLVLSFTGGKVLAALEDDYHARMVRPLYGCVDPDDYCRVAPVAKFQCDLSYMGTYSADRQAKLDTLLLEPSRRHPEKLVSACRVAVSMELGMAGKCAPHGARCAQPITPAFIRLHGLR